MRAFRLGAPCLCTLLAISAGVIACQRHPAEPETKVETYAPTEGAVGLDIIPLENSDGARRWLAIYTDAGKTTKFAIELGSIATSGEKSGLAMGKGRFVAQTDSDPLPLLNSLKTALQAKHMPTQVQRADVLPFNYLLLGENQTRLSDGGFRPNPKGDWTSTKIFLANDAAEIYFNFNPVIHKAELSIKDAAFGDRVLAELAKVL